MEMPAERKTETTKGRRRADRHLTGGAGITDITPEIGTQLLGYPYEPRHSTGVHDPLFATCLILDDGMVKIVLIQADLCYFEKEYVNAIRDTIAHEMEIPKSHIMISASHTHSGPRMATRLTAEDTAYGFRVENKYLEQLQAKLVNLALKTNGQRRRLLIGFGEGLAGAEKGIGGNRNRPEGAADPAVGVIGIKDADDPKGEWLAVWVKYSLHPTILQADNTLISADYPGAVRKCIKTSLPHAITIFAQGATGDQSSRYFRHSQTDDEVRRFGSVIGLEACRVLDGICVEGNMPIGVMTAEVEPVWRDLPTLESITSEAETLSLKCQNLEKAGASYADRQSCRLERLGAEYTRSFLAERARGAMHPWEYEKPLEVQAFRIGDNCIIGLQGEVFVQYTLEIAAKSPFRHTFVVTLANGLSPGYIVTEEAVAGKVYEAGTSLLKPETGTHMVRMAMEICDKLYQNAEKW